MNIVVIVEINNSLKNSTFLAEARAVIMENKFRELHFDTSIGIFMGEYPVISTIVNKIKHCPSYNNGKKIFQFMWTMLLFNQSNHVAWLNCL